MTRYVEFPTMTKSAQRWVPAGVSAQKGGSSRGSSRGSSAERGFQQGSSRGFQRRKGFQQGVPAGVPAPLFHLCSLAFQPTCLCGPPWSTGPRLPGLPWALGAMLAPMSCAAPTSPPTPTPRWQSPRAPPLPASASPAPSSPLTKAPSLRPHRLAAEGLVYPS